MDVNLVHLVLTLQLEMDHSRPYPFVAVRPFFSEAFRQAAGCTPPVCSGTRHHADCVFQKTFAQELSTDPDGVRRHQKPPLPFVFSFPPIPPLPHKGATVEVGLTLIGTAVNHLATYLNALYLLFRHERLRRYFAARLVGVSTAGPGADRVSLLDATATFQPDRLRVLSFAELAASAVVTETVSVEFLTPLRIIRDGKPLRDLPFSALSGALLRRVSALAYYYGGVTLPFDFPWLASQSRGVVVTGADLRWAEWRGGAQGLVGRISYAGPVDDLAPFLLLGEILQVGKGSAYGMGRYRLLPGSPS